MSYTVTFRPSFFRDLKKLPRELVQKVSLVVERIREDPFSVAAKKLAGQGQLYRYRLGDYRIVYYVDPTERKVLFLFVGHRKEIYRHLKR